MNLTKEEKSAIELLKGVLNSCLNGEDIRISTADHNSIKSVLGFDIKASTLKKKEVKEIKRGKSDFKIIITNTMGSTYPDTYGFFPFQIKELKR
ncbi:hypothetical protein [Flammeovirga aprica]|uniref:Uncharacterized protein n=1 Tax=Flammeovirga aprica JL-4 TaxID=694437 RepID=A0A7X9P1Y2_9BACT|nr:hypothetical protein [Flammeovirga aprica]NME67184.1 hypothetical protein [Flammeovirga aprica JL-4]